MYRIEGNTVKRDGVSVAFVCPDGTIESVEGMEQYRTQCVKVLAKEGRRRDDGTFVFDMGEVTMPMDENHVAVRQEEAPRPPRVISTVRELVAEVEAASGDPAPPFSPIWGDETPEVWSYLRRHVDEYNAIRANADIRIKHNHIEE